MAASTSKSATTKREVKKPVRKEKDTAAQKTTARYVEGVGRRKTSIARVRLVHNGTGIAVNEKDYRDYFPTQEMRSIVEAALKIMNLSGEMKVSVNVEGGGIHSQAEAVRHGIARALVEFNAEFRKQLRKAGFLTRDPRMKERRKFGLKKARRAPQWSKR